MKHKPKPGSKWIHSDFKPQYVAIVDCVKYGTHKTNKNTLYVRFNASCPTSTIHGYSRELAGWFKKCKPYET